MQAKTSFRVLILDDEEQVEEAIRSKLPSAIAKQASTVKPNEIARLVSTLGGRIESVRKSSRKEETETPFDLADIFIVDYDLVKAVGEDYLTGEMVAYLARCYSTCGIIVGLNQFHRSPTFDLSFRAELNSFADLNISASDLKNLGLWRPDGWKGYRPWAWPVLPQLVELFRQRVADVARVDIGKTTVVDFLQLPTSVVERLPISSLEQLGSSRTRPEMATLKDILASRELGFRGKEAENRKPAPVYDARIIAARLARWLNNVLATQDVLVDAPHLVERCPSALGLELTPKSAAKVTGLDPDAAVFRNKELKAAKFEKAYWFDRPVWCWTEIERLRLLKEISEPWNVPVSKYAFCEDTSVFQLRSKCTSFQTNLSSPYRTRYISKQADIDYQPAHRLVHS
jgi:hypothetical protein